MKAPLAILLTVVAQPVIGATPYDIPYFDEQRSAVIFLRAGGPAPLIYLRSGKPVAYLIGEGGADIPSPWRASFVRQPVLGGVDLVYSLGGKHLGWFSTGRMWDIGGQKTCQTKEGFRDDTLTDPLTHGIPSKEVSREPREVPQPMPRLTLDGWSAKSCREWITGHGRDL